MTNQQTPSATVMIEQEKLDHSLKNEKCDGRHKCKPISFIDSSIGGEQKWECQDCGAIFIKHI